MPITKKHQNKLSVVIVSYNTKQLLNDCIDSVKKADHPAGGLEIIVVDNNSPDDSVQMIKQKYPKVKLIANKDNTGFAAANNQGVEISTGQYVLFLNSDTVVHQDSFTKPLKYLDKNPQVGALTVRLELASGHIDPDNHRGFPTPWTSITHFTHLDRLFPQSKLFNRYYKSYQNFNQTHSIEVAAGSYLLMKKDLFLKIGAWCEDYFFYGEDIDLCYRVHQAGKDIVYFPHTTVMHYKGASSGLRKESKKIARPPKKTRIKVARSSTNAMKIFYRKFYRHKYPKPVTGFVLAAVSILGFFRVLKHRLT